MSDIVSFPGGFADIQSKPSSPAGTAAPLPSESPAPAPWDSTARASTAPWDAASGLDWGPTLGVAEPTPFDLTGVAPPHLQPLSDLGNAPDANLGFATLDDWFGNVGEDTGDVSNNALAGLDLQDFWMKIGASEVSQVVDAADNTGTRRVPI